MIFVECAKIAGYFSSLAEMTSLQPSPKWEFIVAQSTG